VRGGDAESVGEINIYRNSVNINCVDGGGKTLDLQITYINDGKTNSYNVYDVYDKRAADPRKPIATAPTLEGLRGVLVQQEIYGIGYLDILKRVIETRISDLREVKTDVSNTQANMLERIRDALN
jgi:hypothetical protein